jgi:hypothetical protein
MSPEMVLPGGEPLKPEDLKKFVQEISAPAIYPTEGCFS